jgi:hypothetical protein
MKARAELGRGNPLLFRRANKKLGRGTASVCFVALYITGNGTAVRACNKQGSCITCNMARRKQGSGKCNQCQLAVTAAFFSTSCKRHGPESA